VALSPDFSQVTLLKRVDAEKSQTLVFKRKWLHLSLLSTNNFPWEVKKVVEDFVSQWFECELYYTWVKGFEAWMSWYDQIEEEQQERVDKKDAQERAEWQNALTMIEELFKERHKHQANDVVLQFIKLSFQAGASDLHFQSEKEWVFMNVRIDGVMHPVVSFTHKDFLQYLAKIKFMAGIKMNIDALPQDGRFSFDSWVHGEEESVDVRVSTLPGLYSDGVVMRFLQWTQEFETFASLGFRQDDVAHIASWLDKKYGMIFVTWPTGCWKTTTLYTMLNYINDGTKKIVTLENPIEFQLDGVQQSQINESKGYSYEDGLKAILRHDPDVILVWETRSHITAETVVNASLTWHMVFTTVHTDSALDAIPRLLSMGIKTYLLAPVASLICAQRLVRRVCSTCAQAVPLNEAEKTELSSILDKIKEIRPSEEAVLPETTMKAVGCDRCNGTGYRGRLVIAEVLPLTDEMREVILSGEAKKQELFVLARKWWFLTMKEDGVLKVLEWLTTMDELRVVV